VLEENPIFDSNNENNVRIFFGENSIIFPVFFWVRVFGSEMMLKHLNLHNMLYQTQNMLQNFQISPFDSIETKRNRN
jgi:hypothetical protein